MRLRNQEINIFSLSMLDVISGAMGAFIVIMIVLFPYYGKKYTLLDFEEMQLQAQEAQELANRMAQIARNAEQRAQEAQTTAEQLRQMAQDAEKQAQKAQATIQQSQQTQAALQQSLQDANQRAERAERKLASATFLLVHIRWTTEKQDVDLHIVNPTGAEFYFGRKTIPGSPGELAEDDTQGPGSEVWLISKETPPGTYLVYVNLYKRNGNFATPKVTGKVYYQDGCEELPSIDLTQEDGSAGNNISPQAKKLMAKVIVKRDGSVEFQ